MGSGKFDHYDNGKYVCSYFNRDKEFYSAIKAHIKEAISKRKTVGVDIGAGPGIGARLFADLNFETKLTGFEPSLTGQDGRKLSKALIDKGNSVLYVAKCCGISDITTPNKNSLNYILVLRASHEIAESLGSKNKFFRELKRIIVGLKDSGVLIIAEPQYAEKNPDKETIRKVQEYQKETIGHCHVPPDYITAKKMQDHIIKIGLRLLKETIIPNKKLLSLSFYVQTFQK